MNPEDIKAAALAATIDRENRKVVVAGVSFDPTEARQLAEGLKVLATEAEAIPHHRPGDVFVNTHDGDHYISDGVSLLLVREGAAFALAIPARDILWRRLRPVKVRTVTGTPGVPVGEVIRAAVHAEVAE